VPAVWNQDVTGYTVDVFESSTLSYDRSLRLDLANGHRVAVEFPPSAPTDNVSIGTSFHTVRMDAHKFDEVYHLLQTEKPVRFSAYEYGAVRFVGFSTGAESVGEGLVDADS
jgi:hypothetical protein